MTVIDVDSHFMESFDWFARGFPELASQLPPANPLETLVESLFGDVLSVLPPSARPDPMDLIPEGFRPLAEMLQKMTVREVADFVEQTDVGSLTGAYQAPGARDSTERIAYLDEQGIDVQFVVPTAIVPYRTALKAGDVPLALASLAACNTWNAETAAPHVDRLVPVTLVDLIDLDWAVAELARMRAQGSRVFQIKGEPVDGRSLAHPDFERLWSAATDLGMLALLHVGGGRTNIAPGWYNNGGDFAASTLLGATQYHGMADVALTGLILGGVFDRHPKLSVVVAELGIGWVPYWLERLDMFFVDEVLSSIVSSTYSYPLRPSEYAKQHVRVTPLPIQSQLPAAVIEQVGPDMIVFSSDYPHPEGSAAAMAHHQSALAGTDERVRERFFGGSMAEVLTRADGG